jgi:putative heme-binding domain-containing protein
LLAIGNEHVWHVAAMSLGLQRDVRAAFFLAAAVGGTKVSPANRRIAAEALGRIGDADAAPYLMKGASLGGDRFLQHSIIYALIELSEANETRHLGIAQSLSPAASAAALIALDQMPGGNLKPNEVIPHLGASDTTLRDAATWVVQQRPEWGGDLVGWLTDKLQALPPEVEGGGADPESTSRNALEALMVASAANEQVQQLLADTLRNDKSSPAAQRLAIQVMVDSKLPKAPESWVHAIAAALGQAKEGDLPLIVAAARRFPVATMNDNSAAAALAKIVDDQHRDFDIRVEALSILLGKHREVTSAQFNLLQQALGADRPVAVRSAAAEAIAKSHLTETQLDRLRVTIESAGPLELNRLLKPFGETTSEELGLRLVSSLKKSPSLISLRMDVLREALAKYSASVQKAVGNLESLVNVDAAAQRQRIEELMPLVTKGDVRRGHAVFYSSKAACSSCHRLGYAGGTTGPELTHVGKTRTERDILESILFPSLSFVRSYEPMMLTTQDGKAINGVIKNETSSEYIVATGPDQEIRIARNDVEEIQPSKVSIMPAGLDKQLTPGEIADLVTFLKTGAGQ